MREIGVYLDSEKMFRMGDFLMKKLISGFITGVMLACSAVGVYADEVSQTSVDISTAVYDTTTKKVNVAGSIKNRVDSQSITVMSTGVKNNTFDLGQIVYIDQNDDVALGENGSFTLSFSLSDSAVTGVRYFVRIGGTGIDNPAYMAFNFTAEGDVTVVYGDVNNDGVLDINDASVLMKYVLDPTSVDITAKGFENAQIQKQKVDEFTSADVAMILQKALDSTYKFPVETVRK